MEFLHLLYQWNKFNINQEYTLSSFLIRIKMVTKEFDFFPKAGREQKLTS